MKDSWQIVLKSSTVNSSITGERQRIRQDVEPKMFRKCCEQPLLTVPLSFLDAVLKNTGKPCILNGITPYLPIVIAGVKTWLNLYLFV